MPTTSVFLRDRSGGAPPGAAGGRRQQRPDPDRGAHRALVTVEDLVAEARARGRRSGPWLRSALDDARRGMRSVGESDLRRVVLAAGLPEPEWNAPVETPRGTFLVDALWRDRGVGAEADGRAWHLDARDWADDLRRQNALHGAGLVLLRFPVARLRTDRLACSRELAVLVG